MVAGADVLHLAGTVQMQEHAVQRAEVCADIVQQAVLDVIKGVAGDHTARKAIGVDRGYHFDAGIREHGAHVHLRNGVLAKPQVIIFQIGFVGDVGVGLGHKLRHQNSFAHSSFPSLQKPEHTLMPAAVAATGINVLGFLCFAL